MRIIFHAFCLLTLLAGGAARADESTPLSYSRGQVAVLRQSAPSLPWQAGGKNETSPLYLDAEIREGITLYNQKGWVSLSSPGELQAAMLIFTMPVMAPIVPSSQYAPLDILFINKEGTILQILPNLVLTELEEDIYPSDPILAFLLLKGGTCEKYSIQPGDSIQHKRFRKPPVVLTAPPPVAPTTPTTTPPADPLPVISQ